MKDKGFDRFIRVSPTMKGSLEFRQKLGKGVEGQLGESGVKGGKRESREKTATVESFRKLKGRAVRPTRAGKL